MPQSIATVALVVRDYDEAIAWYTGRLGFALVEDTRLSETKRWVVVAPPGDGTRLLLAKAADAEQASRIGNQTGGRVALFLETDDFAADHARLSANGVVFREAPRAEPYGTVAVFADLYGNRWDLIEPRTGRSKPTPITLRAAVEGDLPTLTDLCIRSKAVWGYDAAFMEACRDELTLRPIDLATSSVAVAEQAGAVTGVVQVSVEDDTAELDKLFVDPDALRGGLGRLLFAWAVAEARRLGAVGMTIDADPDAVPFYRRMGGVDDGVAPSASIPGRVLPRLVVDLGN